MYALEGVSLAKCCGNDNEYPWRATEARSRILFDDDVANLLRVRTIVCVHFAPMMESQLGPSSHIAVTCGELR